MNLKESIRTLRKIRNETEDGELAGIISDVLGVYDWVDEDEEDENAVNEDG